MPAFEKIAQLGVQKPQGAFAFSLHPASYRQRLKPISPKAVNPKDRRFTLGSITRISWASRGLFLILVQALVSALQ